MPTDIVPSVPNGADVSLDANVFIYAFTAASRDCDELLTRCALQQVYGVTSFEVIHETTHRLMVGEAFQKGLIAKPRGGPPATTRSGQTAHRLLVASFTDIQHEPPHRRIR